MQVRTERRSVVAHPVGPGVSSQALRPAPSLTVQRLFPLAGVLPGFRQPAVVAEVLLHRQAVAAGGLARIESALARVLPDYAPVSPADDAQEQVLLECIIRSVAALLASARVPTFCNGRVLGRREVTGTACLWQLALPCLGHDHQDQVMMRAALGWVIDLANRALHGLDTAPAVAALPATTDAVKAQGPQGFNTIGLLRAADERDVPWQRVLHNVYQFGWGVRARWLDSTFTDQTSNIASRLARNKLDAAVVLRRAGIPVPEHALARDAGHAVALAGAFGYPVVVKPADRDGGAGVSPGLRREDAVRRAFDAARALSALVLVEKHFEGNDYRLQVYRDQVFWAAHRVPGGVTGDGTKDVAHLLDELNADPRRGERGTGRVLKRIPLDAQALELLAEQGLTAASVPAAGHFVRLRRSANVGGGGMPVAVLDKAHPDNLALGVRAARALRLDLAGVDLLAPDISRSWLETGAVVCEVNAQPQMSPNLPAWLIQHLVPDDGRVPVVMMLGNVIDTDWYAVMAQALRQDERAVGIVTAQGVELAGKSIAGAVGVVQGVQMLLSDSLVRGLLAVVSDERGLEPGFPVDRLDVLVLAGPLRTTQTLSHDAWRRWEDYVRRLAPHCRSVWVLEDCQGWSDCAGRLGPDRVESRTVAQITQGVQRILEGVAP